MKIKNIRELKIIEIFQGLILDLSACKDFWGVIFSMQNKIYLIPNKSLCDHPFPVRKHELEISWDKSGPRKYPRD